MVLDLLEAQGKDVHGQSSAFVQLLPAHGPFQVQIEGGEPLCHPEFWEFVRVARAHPGCHRLVLCTNGTLLPRKPRGLLVWLERLGTPFTLKLSLNHFLLERDPHLIELATLLRDLMGRNPERSLVVNVRRRRAVHDDDRAVVEAVERAGLLPFANVFFLQRYGNASCEDRLGAPEAGVGQLPPHQPGRPRLRPRPRRPLRGDAAPPVTATRPGVPVVRPGAPVPPDPGPRTPDPNPQPGRVASRRPFDPWRDSTAGRFVDLDLWGVARHMYANANLSIYSGQPCTGGCGFCVEKLRPAARGVELDEQKRSRPTMRRYFSALDEVLDALRPVDPSVSLTGGEPSLDPRLPRLLRTLQEAGMRKRTMTTNGSGLLEVREGRAVVDWVTATGVRHLNLSRAHPADADNARLMQLDEAPDRAALAEIVARTARAGTRPRLSCVLLRDGVADLDGVLGYLSFAESLGVDNVVFRQLMTTGEREEGRGESAPTHPCAPNRRTLPLPPVLQPCQREPSALTPGLRPGGKVAPPSLAGRVALPSPLSPLPSLGGRWSSTPTPSGWRWGRCWRSSGGGGTSASRSGCGGTTTRSRSGGGAASTWCSRRRAWTWLAESRQRWPELVFELVFHPNAVLCSTWQPWDGAWDRRPLGPGSGVRGPGSGWVGEEPTDQAADHNSPRWVGSRHGIAVSGFDGERAYELVEEQCALGPRVAGSPGNARCRELIAASLEGSGWPV